MKDKQFFSKKEKIRVIELFAGVGGFRLGLTRASKLFEIVWSNQWEPRTKIQHASLIYTKHFGDKNHSNEDIRKVKSNMIPNHDLLVGGFPCQDYSVANTLKNAKGLKGKHGSLWNEIIRIIKEKKKKSPKLLLLENVDRLLKSPAEKRGRDFATILSTLNKLGYIVEWRVINAAEYGMPQKRKRVFIFAFKKKSPLKNLFTKFSPKQILEKEGLFAKTFPVKKTTEKILNFSLPKKNKTYNEKINFQNAGFMINGKCWTVKLIPNYKGKFKTLKNCIVKSKIEKEFFVNDKELKKWKYCKGAKKVLRTSKLNGFKYNYEEGKMAFPDSLNSPARTITTSEGGASPSRSKHIILVKNKYRRLTPKELERINMFPDDFTKMEGVSNVRRAFLMGNALVVGLVERIGNQIATWNRKMQLLS